MPVLRTSELEYDLPADRVARVPSRERDGARLMVVDRASGACVRHAHVRDLLELGVLRAGDCLVLNTTRVLRARLGGSRADTGGKVEGLYLGPGTREDLGAPSSEGEISRESPRVWRVLLQGKRLRAGVVVALAARDGSPAGVSLRLIAKLEGEAGGWLVEVDAAGSMAASAQQRTVAQPSTDAPTDHSAPASDADLLDRIGRTPLPPYITRARAHQEPPQHPSEALSDEQDAQRYQTVFAGRDAGSVAAPTAGLHLTPELLARAREQGIDVQGVVLHVGTGTFRTVEAEFVEQHPMHYEWCAMSTATRRAILRCKERGGRVVCVGTTAARTLEAFAREEETAGVGGSVRGSVGGSAGAADDALRWLHTNILITPGHTFRWVDGLLTNFHLPRSTLLAMVGALLEPGGEASSEGVARLKALYGGAVREGYRFYSYGDAMIVV